MYLYKGGPDIPLTKNNSKKYYNGAKFTTNNFGNITIVGRVNATFTKVNSPSYIVSFSEGTLLQVWESTIRRGTIKNPNTPTVFEKGFMGQGEYSSKTNPAEYRLWQNMLKRCYLNKNNKQYVTYRDVTVCERWHNFQNFCVDIKGLQGYDKWKEGTKEKRNPYDLDKDIKVKGNKVYAPDVCLFLTHKENTSLKCKECSQAVSKKDKSKQIIDARIHFLNNIDCTRFGWIKKVSNEWGVSHTQVRRWINKHYPSLIHYTRNNN